MCHDFLGHQVVADLEGVPIRWHRFQGFGVVDVDDTHKREKIRNLALGGFGAQVLSAEILLGVESIPKDSPFVVGWMIFNCFSDIGYPLVHNLSPNGFGDFKTLEDYAEVDTQLLQVGLVAHGLLSAYRLY